MSFQITPLDLLVTGLVRTLGRKFHYESPNRNIGLKRTHNAHVAQRADACVFYTPLAEQIVAAWRLNGILIYVKTYRTYPPVIRQTAG